MPFTLSPALKAHLALPNPALAFVVTVHRRDLVVQGWTDWPQDLLVEGVTHRAGGIERSAWESANTLAVGNLEVKGTFEGDDDPLRTDLQEGRFDGAAIRLQVVNPEDLTMGALAGPPFAIGDVRVLEGGFTFELRDPAQGYSRPLGRVYKASCRHEVFDAGCGLDPAPWTVTGTVVAITGPKTFASDVAAADGAYALGRVHWLSGANTGAVMEVRGFAGGAVTLALAMPAAIAAGDSFELRRGCDLAWPTCRDVFANGHRFGGYFAPNPDAVSDANANA